MYATPNRTRIHGFVKGLVIDRSAVSSGSCSLLVRNCRFISRSGAGSRRRRAQIKKTTRSRLSNLADQLSVAGHEDRQSPVSLVHKGEGIPNTDGSPMANTNALSVDMLVENPRAPIQDLGYPELIVSTLSPPTPSSSPVPCYI